MSEFLEALELEVLDGACGGGFNSGGKLDCQPLQDLAEKLKKKDQMGMGAKSGSKLSDSEMRPCQLAIMQWMKLLNPFRS